jgi:hypothetical protein
MNWPTFPDVTDDNEPDGLRRDDELEDEGEAELEGRILSDFRDWKDEQPKEFEQ